MLHAPRAQHEPGKRHCFNSIAFIAVFLLFFFNMNFWAIILIWLLLYLIGPPGYNLTSANCHDGWRKSNAHCPRGRGGEAGGSVCLPHGNDEYCPCWELLPLAVEVFRGKRGSWGSWNNLVASGVCLGPTQHAQGFGLSLSSSFPCFTSQDVTSELKSTYFLATGPLGGLEPAEQPLHAHWLEDTSGPGSEKGNVAGVVVRWCSLIPRSKQSPCIYIVRKFVESVVWEMSTRPEEDWVKICHLMENWIFYKVLYFLQWMCTSLRNPSVTSKKHVLEYRNIFGGGILLCSCSHKWTRWFSCACCSLLGHVLFLGSCNRGWPCVTGIQGGKMWYVRNIYVCMCRHWHKLFRRAVALCSTSL